MGIVDRNHFKTLIKKNWIYFKRNKILSAVEVLLPIFLMLAILATRILINRTNVAPIDYPDKVLIDNEEY